MRRLAVVAITLSLSPLVAQAPIGEPRWMPVAPIGGPRTKDAVAMEQQMRAFVDLVKRLPVLTPPPGVYPKASVSLEPAAGNAPHVGIIMLGFWPPKDVVVRNGQLASAGELSHLIVYINRVREDAFSQDTWADAEGPLYPQPTLLGNVQGFPVYQGFGAAEVSGILVIQPEGRSLFEPVSQERFRRFAIATMEKRLQEYAPSLKSAQEKYNAAVSEEGRAARQARIAQSLEEYGKARQRTSEQMAYRRTSLETLDAEEVERLRLESIPESNRLHGPLIASIARERAALDALSPEERGAPACTVRDSRDPGPHPAPTDARGCVPVVSMRRWWNPSLPRTAWQLVTIERYWSSAEDVRRGHDRSQRTIFLHVNKEVVEAIDWKAFGETFMR